MSHAVFLDHLVVTAVCYSAVSVAYSQPQYYNYLPRKQAEYMENKFHCSFFFTKGAKCNLASHNKVKIVPSWPALSRHCWMGGSFAIALFELANNEILWASKKNWEKEIQYTSHHFI